MSLRIRRRRAGLPFLLSGLLLASVALRIGADVGQAVAAAEDGGEAPLTCPAPPIALAQALSEREGVLDAREAAISEREAALDLAKQIVEQQLAALESAERSLRKTVSLSDGAAEADLARLTEVYQSMKPKDAAAVFALMDPQFAAGFLGRMEPAAAAAILSDMDPEAAFAMSALLATRNASAPKK